MTYSSSVQDEKKKNVKIMKLKSYEEFCDLAKEYHGHVIDFKLKKEERKWVFRKIRNSNDAQTHRPFIVHKLFQRGDNILLVGNPEVGKSMVAMDLSLMTAGGESIGDQFTAENQYNVIYIDAEMSERTFDSRYVKLIKGNYKKSVEMYQKYFASKCLRDLKENEKFDLSQAEDRQEFVDHLKDVDLLVLDTIEQLFFPNSEITKRGWKAIERWLRLINQNGTTVLLVHHNNKEGSPLGPSDIIGFVDVIISLEKPSEKDMEFCKNKSSMTKCLITKGRDLLKKEKEGFFLTYYDDEIDKIDRTILSINGIKIERKNFVTEYEINKFALKQLDIDILNKARNPNVEFVTAADFKDENTKGRKGQTVTDHLNKLVKLGLLASDGKNKGRKYRALSQEIPQ
jgi:KaiC/GvpD/RAD55 family RecA-like ATPase